MRSTWTATRCVGTEPAPDRQSISSMRPASTGRVVAHGCTGKGNDQVRFEVGFASLAPDLEVLAPSATTRGPGRRPSPSPRTTRSRSTSPSAPVLDRPERVGPRGGNRLPGNTSGMRHQGRLRLHRRPNLNWNTPDEVVVGSNAGSQSPSTGNRHRAASHRGAQSPRRRQAWVARRRRGPAGGHQEREIYEGPRRHGPGHAHTES